MEPKASEYSDYALWVLLIQAYRSANYTRAKELRKCQLSLTQAGVLEIVKSLDNYAKPIDIARRMFREPQTMTTIIDIMLKKGLIKTTKDVNRKNIVRISLTEKGENAYEESLVTESVHQIMSSLTDEKRQQLRKCLEEIVENAKIYTNLTHQDPWLSLFDSE